MLKILILMYKVISNHNPCSDCGLDLYYDASLTNPYLRVERHTAGLSGCLRWMRELHPASKIPWLEKKGNKPTLEITLKLLVG
jgi:hypothetical protein